jgi:hypothetical protein
MIRVDHDSNDETAKRHLESRTKKSIVGWIKHIVDNFPFEDITIYNLLTECPVHKEHWEKKGGTQCKKQSATSSNMTSVRSTSKIMSNTLDAYAARKPSEKSKKEDKINPIRETS